MKHHALHILAAAALALAVTVPAAAQEIEMRHPSVQRGAPLRVIALQVRVQGRGHLYDIKQDEAIPINAGERLRLDLVGTALVDGDGEEQPVDARFTEASAHNRVEIVQTGSNWLIVQARAEGGVSQIEYAVTGNYDMKGALREGRITFEVRQRSGFGVQPDVQRDRWNRARELNAMLYRTILDEEPRGTVADDDLQHIYRLGYAGVRDVAQALAEEAELDHRRLSENEAVRIVGDLYRGLLLRRASDRDLWDTDRGFRGNVQALRDRGLSRIVLGIVDAEEFRSIQQIYQMDTLRAGELPRDYSTESWRRDRGRPHRY